MIKPPPQWSDLIFEFIEKETKVPKTNINITKLIGDASNRTFYRLDCSKKTWILIETNPFPDQGEKFPYIDIQKYLLSSGVRVPHLYAFSPALGILLVEDFGDNFLEKLTQHLSPKQYSKYYFLALDELFKIHFEASQKKSSCIAFEASFDTEKLMWELNFTKKYLFQGHFKISISPQEEIILNESFWVLCSYLDRQPRYFTHRDYHSRNLMALNGQIGVLDFQDARMGPCQYDLVSLLKDSYVQLPKELHQELLKYYIFEKSRREKVSIHPTDFRKTFDWMSIQRNLKAMGTFGYLNVEKGKSNYLKYLKPTWQYVRENLEKFSEFKELYKILSKYCESLS